MRKAGTAAPSAFGGLFPKKTMDFSIGNEPHTHPHDVDSDDGDEGDYYEKKLYFMCVFGLSAVAMLVFLVAVAAPAWAVLPASKAALTPLPLSNVSYISVAPANSSHDTGYIVNLRNQNVSAVREWRMFGECLCYQTSDEPCSTVRRLFVGGKTTSLLACAAQLLIAGCLAALYAGFFRKFDRPLHIACCVASYVASAALLITFASFAAAFDRTLCGEIVKSRGALSWAYGVRAAEFAFSAIFTSGITFQTVKRSRRLAKTLLFGQLCVLGFSVLTTTSRGWVFGDSRRYELGLWEGCYCFTTSCNAEISYLQSIQAHVVLTILALGLFIAIHFLHLPKWVQLIILGAAFATECVTLGVFWGFFTSAFCGKPSIRDQGFVVRWPVFLPIAVMVMTLCVFIVVVARTRGLITAA